MKKSIKMHYQRLNKMREKKFLPFALPSIGEKEIQEVVDTLKSGWLTTGIKTKTFEEDFCQFVGDRHALATNSATAGLHLALEAAGIKRGDKVITTPYTFTATAEVIHYLGADPIFIDIDKQTFNIDPVLIEQACRDNPGIKAIIPVHFAGQACEMDEILSIARLYNLKVIEDAAHALPTSYKGKMIGTLGDLTVYSFYVTKTIATGEGGMVVTNNDAYAERIKVMRLHGINKDVFDRYVSDKPKWYYEVVEAGYKYNMTDITASIGIHQLKKTNQFQKRRQWIAEQYNEAFKDLPLLAPYVKRIDDIHAWHLYVIQLDLEKCNIGRDEFIENMSEEGIGTSVHFIPLHIQPYWRDRYDYKAEDFPNAYDVYQRAVSLPIYPKMTDNDVQRVIEAVRNVLLK
jgi:dTDP-4-amino-4,6-dideoxygalactose transaminase